MKKISDNDYHRELADFNKLKRSPLQSHFLTQFDLLRRRLETRELYSRRLKDFLSVQIWSWLYHYCRSRFGRKHPFPDYTYSDGNNGIYRMRGDESANGEIRISLTGDWASGCYEADVVARQMENFEPHYTIHLGDTYFVGTDREIRENFFTRVQWPMGSRGSFALNGNHEMYAKGKAYFTRLLPQMGFRDEHGKPSEQQKTSFLALENDYWRIVCLDTAYHSIGLPILENIIHPKCELHPRQMYWLREILQPKDDPRSILLLSHHQYYSAFERAEPRPAAQLATVFDKPLLWIWAHEHRFAMYKQTQLREGLIASGRCLGTGGMPVEVGDQPDLANNGSNLQLYDDRIYRRARGKPVGYNGFANLRIDGAQLQIEYRDVENRLLVGETWVADLQAGRPSQEDLQVHEPALTIIDEQLQHVDS